MDEMQRLMQWTAAAVATVAAVGMVAGCSSSPESDPSMDEVVGTPPDEDSEDHEFALPPRHPGAHGDVDTQKPVEAESGYPQTEAVQPQQIDRLQRLGPSVVFEHIRTEPKHDDAFVGFEIVEISEVARPYVEAHLQKGDVITHLNLVRLEKPDDYMEAWDTLGETDQIRVDFERDGEAKEAIWEVE